MIERWFSEQSIFLSVVLNKLFILKLLTWKQYLFSTNKLFILAKCRFCRLDPELVVWWLLCQNMNILWIRMSKSKYVVAFLHFPGFDNPLSPSLLNRKQLLRMNSARPQRIVCPISTSSIDEFILWFKDGVPITTNIASLSQHNAAVRHGEWLRWLVFYVHTNRTITNRRATKRLHSWSVCRGGFEPSSFWWQSDTLSTGPCRFPWFYNAVYY